VKVYRLLWLLLGLALRGRFRDEVYLSVLLDAPDRTVGIVGLATGLDVLARRERFLIIDAVSEDPAPWTEWPDPALASAKP